MTRFFRLAPVAAGLCALIAGGLAMPLSLLAQPALPPAPAPGISAPALAPDSFFDPRPVRTAPPPPVPAAGVPAAGTLTPATDGQPKPVKAVTAKPKPKPAPPVPRETALGNDPRVTFTPDTAVLTALASERYLGIAESGGWQALAAGLTLKTGSAGADVATLKRRLTLSGDLSPDHESGQLFDEAVAAGVRRFQMRHGLKQTGIVSGRTLAELNVPAQTRFRQLAASAQRLGGSAFPFGPRYVVVNIPSASVEAVEDGVVKRRYVAVVGKPDRASPTIEARISSVNLNPTWTVPVSIIKKDIIPHMQKDPNYLAKQKIRILNNRLEEIDPRKIDWNTERAAAFTLRQDPGTGNSLGQIKIDMPNKLAVYMHDTPSKKLFARDERFQSSGCIRVEGIKDFAAWLLEGTGGSATGVWDKAAIEAGIESKERKDLRLRSLVPVAWVYLTGYATADGTVHFRPDVYAQDNATTGALSPQARLD